MINRAKIIDQFPKTISARQHEKLLEKARKSPEEILQSESFRTANADMQLKEEFRRQTAANALRRGMKGRERNMPCPCGSGQKYKKCHG